MRIRIAELETKSKVNIGGSTYRVIQKHSEGYTLRSVKYDITIGKMLIGSRVYFIIKNRRSKKYISQSIELSATLRVGMHGILFGYIND